MTLETMQPFEQSFTVEQGDEERIFPSSPTAESDNYLLETFHQYPHGDFRPTFYNPFEIKHRRRTSRAQLKILEKSFSENAKPSATIRRILAQKLDMTPRGVQIWFQNRRAKAKLLRRKSSVQQQRQQQQHQSSDENEVDVEEYSSDTSSGRSTKSTKSTTKKSTPPSSNTTDISQSSVLFSQFFANVQSNQDVNEFNSFISNMEDTQQKNTSNQNWSWGQQHQQQMISDNVRTVATVAAATAVATSSVPYEPTMLSFGGPTHWLNHENNTEELFQQQSSRRRSCPVPKRSMVNYNNHQQSTAYLSPTWTNSMMPQSTKFEKSGNSSSPPMPILNNNFKRHFSYDSNSPSSIDYCPMQDIHHLNNYAQQHQQLTPPLTASCSASTVAGSPISLDNLYNDPVVVPPNAYYSNNSHISSPLSATTLVTDMMPNFV